MALCGGRDLWQVCVSVLPAHFGVGVFSSIQCVQIVFGFLSEEISLWVVVQNILSIGSSVGGGKFRSLLCRYLGNYYHKKLFFFFLKSVMGLET